MPSLIHGMARTFSLRREIDGELPPRKLPAPKPPDRTQPKRRTRVRAPTSTADEPNFIGRARARAAVFGGTHLAAAPGSPHLTTAGTDLARIFRDLAKHNPELLPGRKLARTAKVARPKSVGSSAGTEDTARISTRVDPRIASLPAPARNLLYAMVALGSFSKISVPIRTIAGMCSRRGIYDKGNAAGQIAGALRKGGKPYEASTMRKAFHAAHGCWIRWYLKTDEPWHWDRPNGDGTFTLIRYAHGDAAGGIYLPEWVWKALRFDPNVERLCKGLGKVLGRHQPKQRRRRDRRREDGPATLARLVIQAEGVQLRSKRKGIPTFTERIEWSRLTRESLGFENKLKKHRKMERSEIPHQKEPLLKEKRSSEQKARHGAARVSPGALRPGGCDWNGKRALWKIGQTDTAPNESALAPGTPTLDAAKKPDGRRKATKGSGRSHRAQQRARKAAHAAGVKRSQERSRPMTEREKIVAQKAYERPKFIIDAELRRKGKPP